MADVDETEQEPQNAPEMEEGDDEDPNEAGEDLLAQAEALAQENNVNDEEEDDENEDLDVSENLKDAVHGSLRLKRLLSRDEDDAQQSKKRKTEDTEKDALVQKLLKRWALETDIVVKHVLTSNTLEELQAHDASSYAPDKFNQWKSVPEQVNKYCSEWRERKMCIGGPLDQASLFRHRWKLTMEQDKKVRSLTHKELRQVLKVYDGTQDLDEVIAEALKAEVDEDISELSAVPDAPGTITVGRVGRLELIDPLADAATFGDANLTFSLKLAKHRKALGHVGRVIATTFEEIETLRERYQEVDESIAVLEDHFAEVYHGVDCTRIAIDKRFNDLHGKLGAVYYNFPHSGAIQGFFDGHPIVNWRHENLMRLFFRALRAFMRPGGLVKVASNSGAIGVRYSFIVGGALENEFAHVETYPFMEWCLHRYGRSYGDRRDSYKRPDAVNNQSYNAQRAEADMVYCFRYEPTGKTLDKQPIRLPPTLKTIQACEDGPFRGLQGTAKVNLAKMLHKRFITEVSGTHVG
mmetsp:Transcript_7436/g.16401  ORF Transcript_7436/g.16401 Transcript_7436/m.16401 type:complete len:522 (-) Transcript_7436:75-1640(-)